jgi:hypothetical protein
MKRDSSKDDEEGEVRTQDEAEAAAEVEEKHDDSDDREMMSERERRLIDAVDDEIRRFESEN